MLTSVPQIPGALIAWLAVEQIDGLLPASFALAGGAMLALVVVDLLPDAWKHGSHARVAGGTALGAASCSRSASRWGSEPQRAAGATRNAQRATRNAQATRGARRPPHRRDAARRPGVTSP